MKTWFKENIAVLVIFSGIVLLSFLLITVSSCMRPEKEKAMVVRCVVDSSWTIGTERDKIDFVRTNCGQTVLMNEKTEYKIGDTLTYVFTEI